MCGRKLKLDMLTLGIAIPLVNVGMYALMTEQFVSSKRLSLDRPTIRRRKVKAETRRAVHPAQVVCSVAGVLALATPTSKLAFALICSDHNLGLAAE